jgi:hypothetical protein
MGSIKERDTVMTCHDFQELLSVYLDRELAAEDSGLMVAHAATCDHCQKERSLLLAMKKSLRGRKLPSMPADLFAAIEAATVLQRHWWNSESFQNRWLPALVGLATAVGAIWLSKSHANPRQPGVIPMAARPASQPVITHALLPSNASETNDDQKGESRDPTKS